MNIAYRFAIATLLVVIFGLSQFVLLYLLIEGHKEIEDAYENRFDSWKLADELRQSSDDLTRFARTYVVTGDPLYRDSYQRVLDIRNGKIPRPDGQTIPLVDKFREMGITDEEASKLREGLDQSDALVSTEKAGFEALSGRFTQAPGGRSLYDADYSRQAPPDREFAVTIMHDAAYHAAKETIMKPIREFESMINARTQKRIDDLERKDDWLLRLSTINMLILIVVAGASYYFVQRPVIQSVNSVAEDLRELADGEADLAHRVEVRGTDEIAALAGAFNSLIDNLAELIGEVRGDAAKVVTGTGEMSSLLARLEHQIGRQTENTVTTTSSAREIAATSVELHSTVSNVADTANETNRVVGAGQDGLERISDSMNELRTANEQIVERLSVINEKTGAIGGVVGAINKVAEQTNLLSLNAAIEAEKAGEYGVGFSVVAREIRRLADDTASATRDIEGNVREVQSAVSAGVMEMDKFRGQVDGSAREIEEISERLSRLIRNVRTLLPMLESVREGVAAQDEGARNIHDSMRQLGTELQATKDSLERALENRNSMESVGRHLGELVERLGRTGV